MYQLRWQALRQPWGQPPGSEQDEHEETACHRIAFLPAYGVIGTGRLHQTGNDRGQIRYMAVRTEYRGMGVGRKILSALEDCARSDGIRFITLHAREAALPFYRELGYELIQASHILYDSIRHYEMTKPL
jgi:ribosomal protein S18 acetylase RimI-like enzyme